MKRNGGTQDSSLRDYGIIYLSGDTDSVSEDICKEIIEFNISQKIQVIQLIINSPGGSCAAGFALIDIMEWSKIPIYTTGIGLIASMGLLVFMTGMKGKRIITPRTAILSHHYSTISWGNHSQLLANRKQQDLNHERIVNHYLRHSRIKSREELEKYVLRDVDTWLTPEEAVKFGIADAIENLNIKKER